MVRMSGVASWREAVEEEGGQRLRAETEAPGGSIICPSHPPAGGRDTGGGRGPLSPRLTVGRALSSRGERWPRSPRPGFQAAN